ncbi:hypothetical protein [Promicromonospora sp. NPDC090134]|uniref:hypothetical protein n=1 Tax=Promicromonospora sp. NPDC090134 TaxID=3364408 RepID=UPI0037F7D100
MTEPRVPARVRRVASEDQARELAAELQRQGRRWPVVVISTPAGHSVPFVDPQRVLDDVAGLAEVVVIPTGDVSWEFSSGMPPDTQVYGGASRVYGTELEWVHQPRRSPLHFAYSTDEDAHVRERLVGDVMRFAVRAGIVGAARSAPDATTTEGRVLGVLGTRALVSTDDGGQVTVAEELVLADVPLARVLAPGMRVTGVLDPVRRLLDVRGMLPGADALRRAVHLAYRVGQVVLARVESVEDDAVRVALAPGVHVRVRRADITGNDLDLLSDLFTVGEVILARRVPAPLDGLALRLDDVDESEDRPVPAIALLDGGPPWLEPPEPEPELPRFDGPLVVGSLAEPHEPVDLGGTSPAPSSGPPTPADLFGLRPADVGPVPTPADGQRKPTPAGKAARDLSLSLDAARSRVGALEKELLDDKVRRRQVELEVERLLGRVGELTERLDRGERRAEQQATALRKARQEAARLRRRLGDAGAEVPEERYFADDEEQLRFEVLTEWARAIPAAEKAGRPLADYTLGPRFLASLTEVEGVSRDRVVWTLVMVLTGLALDMNGLQVHRLRTGAGGDDPFRHRDDGAVCWRVSLQVNTPSARRLHYWKLPGGAYELSRVVLHDDVEP